jgi:hypothetical protein
MVSFVLDMAQIRNKSVQSDNLRSQLAILGNRIIILLST